MRKRGFVLTLTFLLATAAAFAAPPQSNIIETARAAGQFHTLLKALQVAGLTGTLEGAGTFTVFAPTDEAFSKLPPGTLASLLKPENRQKLRAILTYHVASGEDMAAQIVQQPAVTSLNGQQITVHVAGNAVKVNDARVVKPDIRASNGVIHVIDTVLLPAGK